ncbi:dopamine beta hydroxylase [Penaeus vannamei]|uniref:Dopamine beta hydroxylase n=1 Tax=Penaeus vannamei TaxID=6689 RepID=A0A3R7PXL3_PENVA|nr:dopamine beta hydroxylase [Penaeus vannamei]
MKENIDGQYPILLRFAEDITLFAYRRTTTDAKWPLTKPNGDRYNPKRRGRGDLPRRGRDLAPWGSTPPDGLPALRGLDPRARLPPALDAREKDIVFEIQVATHGYVGLGFSPNGGMKGADIVLGWVDAQGDLHAHVSQGPVEGGGGGGRGVVSMRKHDDLSYEAFAGDYVASHRGDVRAQRRRRLGFNVTPRSGVVTVTDRYATGKMIPIIDDSQDVEILGGYENDTHTVLRFARPWNTCDKEHDFQLTSDTMRVIWAYSYDDPVTEYAMTKHDHRGTKSIFLQEPQFTLPTFGEDVFDWEVRMNNVSVSGEVHTVYWCQMFKAPPLSRKAHVIGYEPIIEEKNRELVHHILLYECHLPESERHYEKWLEVEGQQCFTPNMPLSWANCRSPLVGWAVGNEGEVFPDHVGLPIGEEHGGATYFMMEMHYDNPNYKQGGFESGRSCLALRLRVFLTENLEFDAGVLILGHMVSPSHIIPPGSEWKTIGHCDGGVVEQALPAEGVKCVRGLLHAHLLGRDITLRQIRQGRELPVVFKGSDTRELFVFEL